VEDLFGKAMKEAGTIVANRQDVALAARILQGRDGELDRLKTEAEQLREREQYLEMVIEAFMIQYCPSGEGVAEWAIAEALARRAAVTDGE
jgi:hypothetical protein